MSTIKANLIFVKQKGLKYTLKPLILLVMLNSQFTGYKSMQIIFDFLLQIYLLRTIHFERKLSQLFIKGCLGLGDEPPISLIACLCAEIFRKRK